MPCTAKELFGFDIRGIDRHMGSVHDLYFDDGDWSVCFAVADVGRWPSSHRVLIPRPILRAAEKEQEALLVSLRREELDDCPTTSAHEPVSSLRRAKQRASRGWFPACSARPAFAGFRLPPLALVDLADEGKQVGHRETPPRQQLGRGDVHLRSMREVIGYHIQATDDEIGHVEDFVLCDKDWSVRYLVVDTRNWRRGRKVVVEPEWVERIRCEESQVCLKLARAGVEGVPRYDPDVYR